MAQFGAAADWQAGYQIDDYLCISCSACKRACPADAVEVNDYAADKSYRVIPLQAHQQDATEFPKDAIEQERKEIHHKQIGVWYGACV